MVDSYLKFIRYVLDNTQQLPKDIEKMDWAGLFQFCQEQAIAGVVFHTIEKLKNERIEIPREVLLQWFALSEQIKQRNMLLNRRCVELAKMFRNDGFECCILKGQGNVLSYPDPYSRTPGDIDIWVKPNCDGKNKNEDIRRIIEFVKRRNPEGISMYHHVDYGDYNGVEVEVHYRPSFMFNPIHNYRLQKWFMAHSDEQFRHEVELPDGVGKVAIPTPEFNIIFQLSHIYNHVLHEGIGLRQLVDYYFLLKSDVRSQRSDVSLTLKHFGLWKFAGAVMYVMREVFALDEQYMVAPVDERRGKVLLQEIMRGGNFGKYDEANIKAGNRIKKNIQRIKRDIRMMQYFPSECLWEPVFRAYHFFWRLRYN